MKVRDRLIIAAVAAIVVIGAVWLLLVSPERSQVSSLSAQIVTEQAALSSAQSQLVAARQAATGYSGDVHALAQVTTAVPTSLDEASVITTMTKLAGTKVDVHEIDIDDQSAASTGANALGLTFTFNTTYADLESFITALDKLTTTDGTNILADGRLFTIQGITFVPTSPSDTKASVTATTFSQVGSAAGATGASGASDTAAVTP